MNENEMKILVAVLLLLFFGGVFHTVYQALYLAKQQEVIRRAWEKSVKILEAKNRTRKKLEKKSVSLYGEMEKKSLPAKLDGLLAYSGLYTRFPRLTAEKYMAALLAASCLECLALWLLTNAFFLSLGIMLLTLALVTEGIHILCAVRRKRIDDEALHCLDVMELNALTGMDIIEILRKTALKVREPLRTELLNTVIDAGNSGNASQAMRRLCSRMDNKYLKDMILNLEICSRYQANYGEVLKAGKKIFMQDAANRERMKKLHKNTLMFTLVLILVGYVCLQMMSGMVAGEGNAILMLWGRGTAGQLILSYLGAVSVCSIWRSLIKAL